MIKIVSWNIAQRDEAWRSLLDLDADVALLQEATAPPPDVGSRLGIDPRRWRTDGAGLDRPWRTAVVKLSDRVDVAWIEPRAIVDAKRGELAVSRLGTLAAARVSTEAGGPMFVVSMYGAWETPHDCSRRSQHFESVRRARKCLLGISLLYCV